MSSEESTQSHRGCLYIVATPIGNLKDISERAIETLQRVDLIAAEDTRHSGRLLKHYQITTRMISFHEHDEENRAKKIINYLSEGHSVALISDAGTPLISDPGFHLVKAVKEAGYNVVPIPGSCAAITALSASGLPTDRFVFEGFLPAKQNARLDYLQTLLHETRTIIFYESPHRILSSLKNMVTVFGAERYVVIARELTKMFETIYGDQLSELINWLEIHTEQQRGEFVVLVKGAEKKVKLIDEKDLHVLKVLMKTLSLKQAAHLAAEITGQKKNELYQLALDLKQIDN